MKNIIMLVVGLLTQQITQAQGTITICPTWVKPLVAAPL
jgi:hypothetical protein